MSDQRDHINHISVTYHGEINPATYNLLVEALPDLNRQSGITFNLRCKARTKDEATR